MGQQLQVDWVEFRKDGKALYAFCATLGYSRASYVEFFDNMNVESLIGCRERAFATLGVTLTAITQHLRILHKPVDCCRRARSAGFASASSTAEDSTSWPTGWPSTARSGNNVSTHWA